MASRANRGVASGARANIKMSKSIAAAANELSSPIRIGIDELGTVARVSIWVRWFSIAASAVLLVFRPDYTTLQYSTAIGFAMIVAFANAALQLALSTGRSVSWYWLLAISALDITAVLILIAISGGLDSDYFLIYFPVLATIAVAFASVRFMSVCISLIVLIYVLVCLYTGDGLQFASGEDKLL